MDSDVAKTMQAELSSKMVEGRIVEQNEELWIESDVCVGRWMNEWVRMSWRTRRKGRSSRVAVDRAMYSLSVVDRAISDCSLLAQLMGHPQKVTT